jgi:hypothetical protein
LHQQYKVNTKVWVYKGKGAWYFATLPEKESAQIKFRSSDRKRGWGSIRVTATIGDTSWQTSIFPQSGGYLLPIKAEIRQKENIEEGADIELLVEIGGSGNVLLSK